MVSNIRFNGPDPALQEIYAAKRCHQEDAVHDAKSTIP